MLELRNVSLSYENKPVLSRFSLELADGEILALMGPSGCGKTTVLRLIAGLEKPTGGVIVSSQPQISFAFQEPRLLPWLTVEENLSAILERGKNHRDRIEQVLDELGLEGCSALYPDELSGGMKSRVALARTLLFGGDLYLFDEPFAALDEELRKNLILLLRAHVKKHGASAIFVTHQSSDAKILADRIVNMNPIAME